MTLIHMYDSTNPDGIPANPEAVAGYVDGTWDDYTAMCQRFPNAVHISITATGVPGARVVDCERGDLSPESTAAWCRAELNAGRRPTIYCSLSSEQAVRQALQAINIAVSSVDWWDANWNDTDHIDTGAIGTQWLSLSGYDESTVEESWAEPATQTATTAPAPTYPSGAPMTDYVGMAATPSGKGYWQVKSDGSIYSFGDAQYLGGANESDGKVVSLNAPIVSIAAHPKTQGYWLLGADGGVFSYGAVGFYGSLGGVKLNAPVKSIVVSPTGNGYWIDAGDGGVFAFGDADFEGSGVGK